MTGILDGKRVLVTGGHRGIGRAIVEECESAGARTMIATSRERHARPKRSARELSGWIVMSVPPTAWPPRSLRLRKHWVVSTCW
jgi:NAD(P)-dependent dehydrogenase (short-subunit alcohol dehydrogenase family)